MNRVSYGLVWVLVVSAIAAGAYYLLWPRQSPQRPAALPAAEVKPPVAPPAEPAVKHPIEAPPGPAAALPPLDEADDHVKRALTDLLGAQAVLSFLQVDRFVRRAVATVDNLARPHAAPRLWPVNQMPGRFAVSGRGKDRVVSADNARRYTAFVTFIESIDTGRAVALYASMYPLFQQAYEQLGYPGRYFNDRLVSVIDHLLQTPEPAGPLKVELTEIKGELKSVRPWVRYRFSDPALEELSAGQKMLLRVGPTNARRLKAKLVDIRQQVAGSAAAR
jgi:hypothetical protein